MCVCNDKVKTITFYHYQSIFVYHYRSLSLSIKLWMYYYYRGVHNHSITLRQFHSLCIQWLFLPLFLFKREKLALSFSDNEIQYVQWQVYITTLSFYVCNEFLFLFPSIFNIGKTDITSPDNGILYVQW